MLTNLFSESPGRGAKTLVITKRSAAGPTGSPGLLTAFLSGFSLEEELSPEGL